MVPSLSASCVLSFYPCQLEGKESKYVPLNLVAGNEDPTTGKPIKKDKDKEGDKDKGDKSKLGLIQSPLNLVAVNENPVTGKPIDKDKDKDKGGKGKGK